jgi:hypothetical protein
MKPVIRILITVASIIIALAAAIAWFLSPAVPQRTLNKLTTGMPQAEAKKLLGKPREIIDLNNWGGAHFIVWRYTNPFHSGLVDVFFSEDGHFQNYNYERF